MTNQEINFGDLETHVAAQQEENARLSAENEYLRQRVVLLRALVNRQTEELNDLRPKIETEPGDGINTAK